MIRSDRVDDGCLYLQPRCTMMHARLVAGATETVISDASESSACGVSNS